MTAPAPLRPAPSAPRPYAFPSFARDTLTNGLTLLHAPVSKLPIVSVRVVVHAGAEMDPAGREGLAGIAAQLITEGAGTIPDGAALTEAFERLGTGLDAAADWDATFLSLTTTPERLEPAMRLLGAVLREPAFPAREFERLREERLGELMQLRAEPRGVADEAFARTVYDPASRYAHLESGTEESVRALALEAVRQWHARHFTPGNTTVVLCGDIGRDAARELVLRVLGDWPGSAGPSRPRSTGADRERQEGARVVVVPRASAAQSEIRIGHAGLPRLHPDFFPVAVMNAILGGLFSSRINLNLREVHGYTYGAFSAFDWRLGAGPFEVSSAVQSESTAAAVREVLGEVARIREAEVSADELSLALQFLQGVFPIRYETTAAIAGALANLAIYGLPTDYFDTYRDRIAAVTPREILRVARSHISPDRLRVVAVGHPEHTIVPLQSLGLGDLAVEGEDR